MIRIEGPKLQGFVKNVLVKSGMTEKDATTVADHIVFCNLRGIDSHGVMRIPAYLERLKEGGTKTNPKIKVLMKRPSAILLDGDDGMGQVVGAYAVNLAIKSAKKTGFCVVGVRRSCHFGAASFYAMQISNSGMIGFSTTNVNQNMAASGGMSRQIGNNPISISVPGPSKKPIVLDIAMSMAAGGKIKIATDNGLRIPTGWIIDKEGGDSTDPRDLINGGAMLPFGGHKGYGLAFMIEILSGLLVGASCLNEIPNWFKEPRIPVNVGHLFGALNIANILDISDFTNRLSLMKNELKGNIRWDQEQSIFMPGEIEEKTEEERRRDGVPLSEVLVKDLERISADFKEPVEFIRY